MTPADEKAIGDAAVALVKSESGSMPCARALGDLRWRVGPFDGEATEAIARACYAAGIEEGLARARREREDAMLDRARGLG